MCRERESWWIAHSVFSRRFAFSPLVWRIHLIVSAGTSSAMTFSPWRWRNQRLTDVFWLPIAQPVNVPSQQRVEKEGKSYGKYCQFDDSLFTAIKTHFTSWARSCRKSTDSFVQRFNVNAPDIKLHFNDYYLFVVPACFTSRLQNEKFTSEWLTAVCACLLRHHPSTHENIARAQWNWMNGICSE